MTGIFDVLVLAAFFMPMTLMVALNLATYRAAREPHGLPALAMLAGGTDANPPAPSRAYADEELRAAA